MTQFITLKDHCNRDIIVNVACIVTIRHNSDEGNERSKVVLTEGNIYSVLTVKQINYILNSK